MPPIKADMFVTRRADANTLRAELEELEAEEREISMIRRKMHERIDRGFPNDLLIAQERKLSRERRELHRRIDLLRVVLNELERPDQL
jgi:hypothetical protein